jgi:nucleoporin NUP82
MLAVYETIDLGLVSFLRGTSILQTETPILNLLQGDHPSLLPDPIHDDTVYVYHAFGVHALHLGPMLRSLAVALGEEDHGASLDAILTKTCGTDVHPILNTFSVERKLVYGLLLVRSTKHIWFLGAPILLLRLRSPTTFT